MIDVRVQCHPPRLIDDAIRIRLASDWLKDHYGAAGQLWVYDGCGRFRFADEATAVSFTLVHSDLISN